MALVTDGILTQKLPWGLVLIGVFLTIAIELMGLQSLPIAVGVYLPISTSASMFAGGVVRWLVERRQGRGGRVHRRGRVGTGRALLQRAHRGRRDRRHRHRRHRGGLVAGRTRPRCPRRNTWPTWSACRGCSVASPPAIWSALALFAGLGFVLYRVASR